MLFDFLPAQQSNIRIVYAPSESYIEGILARLKLKIIH